MVVEMGKLNLVAMSYDRDAVLNALQKTGAAEIKVHGEIENTSVLPAEGEALRAYLAKCEGALACLSAHTENYNKEHKIKSDILKDGFDVTYAEFMSAGGKKAETDALTEKVYAIEERLKSLGAELSKTRRTMSVAEVYSAVNRPLNSFSDTAHVRIKLGTVPAALKENFLTAIAGEELAECSVLGADADNVLVMVAAHKSADTDGILQDYSFAGCPFADGRSGSEFYQSLKDAELSLTDEINGAEEELVSLGKNIRELKIYCDYVGFELEKAELSEKLRATQTTFLLEAYVPKEAEERVVEALDGVTGAYFCEFTEPSEDETPPTLYKNNKVVENFEMITDMYSPVSYREFDPNTVMAFFYSVFLGFIMADIGYGLLMTGIGSFVYMKNRSRESGLKRLSGVFAVGGIFAIVWGLLFNSFFGISIPYMSALLPDAQKDMWSLLGISIPSVLIISLEIGVVQLMVGYFCRAWQCWRRGQVLDGILDGIVWVVFSLGVALAVVGLIDEAGVPVLAEVGGITAGASLVVAIFTAGRKEKLFGKFTKGFGAAYGIINYASDVLSYARLYGLMLSGAVIAQIVSQYSIDFITGGNPLFIIIGVILMLVGHVFNLAIGLLGAYIHDARLQYVEFYGRFYEGEGELFSPLGSKHKYVYIPATGKS